MPDINPDVADLPIEVAISPAGTQTATATRDLLLIVSALPALIAILGTRDLSKIIAYIASVEFAPALGVLVGAGTLLWRQWLARKKHANELKMASAAPDRVAVVKQS